MPFSVGLFICVFILCSATLIWDRRVFDEIRIDEALENNLEFDTLMINQNILKTLVRDL